MGKIATEKGLKSQNFQCSSCQQALEVAAKAKYDFIRLVFFKKHIARFFL